MSRRHEVGYDGSSRGDGKKDFRSTMDVRDQRSSFTIPLSLFHHDVTLFYLT